MATSPRLTRTERVILECLAKRLDYITTHALIATVWSPPRDEPDGADVTLRVHVGNLRRKLDAVCPELRIKTQLGLGYRLERLEPPPERAV